MCDFKIYAISVLSFIGSVLASDEATLKAENHALQCTTAGRHNATPSKLLEVGSVCGFGRNLVRIHSISLVARHWVAACSSTLRRGLEKFSSARRHNCTRLFAPSPAWEHEFLLPSMAFNTASAFDLFVGWTVMIHLMIWAATGLLLDKLHNQDFSGPLA